MKNKLDKNIELLKKYYDVDLKSKIVTVTFHYEKASDIINKNLKTKEIPQINDEMLTKINDITYQIPNNYKLNVNLLIDDYEGYEHNAILTAIEDIFAFFQYDVKRERGRNLIKILILLLVSVTIIALRMAADLNHWFQSAIESGITTSENVLIEILTIVSWAFVWEAVAIIFMREDEYNSIYYYVLEQINLVSLIDENNNIIVSADNKKIRLINNADSKKERIIKKFIISILCLSFILCFLDICDIGRFVNIQNWKPEFISVLILNIISYVTIIGNSVTGLLFYRYNPKYKKLYLITSIINTAFLLFTSINYIYNFSFSHSYKDGKSITIFILLLIFAIANLITYMQIHKEEEKKIKAKKKLKIK